jgi:outer membrane protein assembly factor BamB
VKSHHVIAACALLLAPGAVRAGLILGIDNSGPLGTRSAFFAVDPSTGSTTSFGQIHPTSGYFATSPSPIDGTLFALSPVNLYRINPLTGESVGYLCYEGCLGSPGEHAYDPSNQNMYALASDAPFLLQMVDRGSAAQFGAPGNHQVSYNIIGDLGASGISVMEYVPGLGLYGTDGINDGYVINETTGHASLLASLTGILKPITGLAYDFDTGQLLASSGVLFGTGPGMIYQLDPATGHATLLNDQAANLFGIAFVTIPEAQPVWMLAGGLALFFTLRNRLWMVR